MLYPVAECFFPIRVIDSQKSFFSVDFLRINMLHTIAVSADKESWYALALHYSKPVCFATVSNAKISGFIQRERYSVAIFVSDIFIFHPISSAEPNP